MENLAKTAIPLGIKKTLKDKEVFAIN